MQPDITLPKTPAVKQYRCYLNQTGTAAPVATVIGNNTIGNIIWTRVDVGRYKGSLTGAFPIEKTFIPPFNMNGDNYIGVYKNSLNDHYYSISYANENEIFLIVITSADVFAEFSTAFGSHPLGIEIYVHQ